MRRRLASLAAVALGAVALGAIPTAAQAHQGNPDFASEPDGVHPAVDGVEVEVLNYDDSMRLTNRGDRTVVVVGYEGEPYVRLSPDGGVEVNRRSPSYYLNADRYARADVPPEADPEAPPEWEAVDDSGQYTWHDHRIHYMAEGVPGQVEDETERTKVFDYEVPLRVDGRPAAIDGSLYWVGRDDSAPIPLIVATAIAALAAVALAVGLRRRRARAGHADRADGKDREAW
jgi:MYXO-CTERM domain-containing protein